MLEFGLDQPAESAGAPAASAALSARAIRRADGLDALQALQRVLYRCAKQDRSRRFHALFDKLTRGDVMWRAWCEVAANQGAPGVDGVSIDAVPADGVPAVQVFLAELAARLRDGSYRPAPLRRVWFARGSAGTPVGTVLPARRTPPGSRSRPAGSG